MSKKILISAENIKQIYGEQTVLDFERFYLYEGEKVGLVGMNGAGKTTLLRILAGQIEPSSGSVKLDCIPFTLSSLEAETHISILIIPRQGRWGSATRCGRRKSAEVRIPE